MTVQANSQQPTASLCPLISIIVPAYNCERYISNALDSLINQDYPQKNYEIIITDDGSTDSTGKICDDYAARYSFVHVTHTEKFGLSCARNVALPQCKGEYITFCDADDFVSPQLISVLTKAIEIYSRPDVIVFHHIVMKLENETDLASASANIFQVYDSEKMKSTEKSYCNNHTLIREVLNPDNKVGGFTWNKIIRSDIARSVYFDENLRVCADQDWLLRLLCVNENLKICIIDYYLYCYVQRSQIGQTRNPKVIYDEEGMNRFILTWLKELEIKNLPSEAAKILRGRIYYISLYTLFKNNAKLSRNVNKKLHRLVKEYSCDYYSSYPHSIYKKIKILIGHILITLHIHK